MPAFTRGVVMGAVCFPLLYLSGPDTVQACDDPPNHYPKPCRTKYSRSVPYIPIAEAAGIFKKRNLDIHPEGATAKEIEETLSETALSQITAALAIKARLDGQRVRIIATLRTDASISFYGSTSASLSELKGKKIAVGSAGFGYGLAMNELLRGAGIRTEEIELIDATFPDRIRAARTGSVNAFAIYTPFSTNVTAEFPAAKPIRTVRVGLAVEVLVAPEKFIADPRNDKWYREVLGSMSDVFKILREDRSAKEWLERAKVQGNPSALADIYRPKTEHVILSRSAVEGTIADLRLWWPDRNRDLRNIKSDDIISSRYLPIR